MSDKVFWYEKNGKKYGGFTASELKALALSGEIDSSCLIWKEGTQNWIPASSAKGLLPPEPTPAPPPDLISPINEPPLEVKHEPTNELSKKNSIMKKSGFVLVFIAVICIVSALLMDTSVATDSGSRVHNIGLMSLQTNLLIGGGFAFISAIILILFGSKSELSDTNKKCPYCAEIIKREAVICKYCGKEQVISIQELEEINKVKEASEKSIQRFKSIGLFIGILLMPYIFSFVTLKKNFSKKIRVASFLYLFLCLFFSVQIYLYNSHYNDFLEKEFYTDNRKNLDEVSITWNEKDISLWQYIYFFDSNFLKKGTLRWFGKSYGEHYHGEINYKNGKKDGVETVWNKSGQKYRESFYKNGELNGVSKEWSYTFNSDGNLTRETPYDNGKINGFDIGYDFYYKIDYKIYEYYKSYDKFYVDGDLIATRKYDLQGRTIEFDNIFFKEKTEYSYYNPPEKFSIFRKGFFVGYILTSNLIREYKDDKHISTTYQFNDKDHQLREYKEYKEYE